MAKKGKKDKINKIEQSVEETTQAINIEEFKGLTYDGNYVENPNIIRTLVESPSVNFSIPQEITIESNSISNEQTVIDIIIKPKRTIESLSKDEFRMYQRTGRIPE
jgi:hypothetical protein